MDDYLAYSCVINPTASLLIPCFFFGLLCDPKCAFKVKFPSKVLITVPRNLIVLTILRFVRFLRGVLAQHSVADPGFPVGGVDPLGGRGRLTWALFTKNVCKNERIGSHGGGGRAPGTFPRSANDIVVSCRCLSKDCITNFFGYRGMCYWQFCYWLHDQRIYRSDAIDYIIMQETFPSFLL